MSNLEKMFKARMEAGGKKCNPLEKYTKNPNSRTLAIKAKCFECVGGANADPGWRRTIGECCVNSCPLWNFRPYQKDENDEE